MASSSRPRALALALGLLSATAQSPTWFGLRPSPSAPHSVDLVDLTDGAVVRTTIGTVALGAGEYAWPDAVRCLPGFCLFATSIVAQGPGAEDESFVYKVSTTDATVIYKSGAPGICAHMHADFSTGHAYTLCIEEAATGYRAVVTEVTGAKPIAVADITDQVNHGRVAPGQTTHCSAFQSMYVGVDNGGNGKDTIITIDLTAGKVSKVTALGADLTRSLWATCDGSGVVGGLSFVPGPSPGANGTATFGAFAADGSYKADSTVGVWPNHEPSGLLTGTSPASYKDAFIAAFYPAGTLTNATAARGALWAVDPYGGGSDDIVTAFGYYLIGAAWDRE
jgi:hypothetical protein